MFKNALIAAGAAVALAGCGDSDGDSRKLWTRDEIADIASDTDIDAEYLESRLTEISRRVEELENQASQQSEWMETQNGIDRSLAGAVDRLTRNERVWMEQLDYLRALHQRPPVPRKD